MNTTFNTQTGARESSAGDVFHLLWASRKVLELLSPKSELSAVSIEGPNLQEMESVDPDGDKILAIDLAEYYGGQDFQSADKVIFSQLKYSTRHPDTLWTASRIGQGKNSSGSSGSIIRRLAEAFESYKDSYGYEAVLSKVQFRLVSNQELSTLTKSALKNIKDLIFKNTTEKIEELINRLSPKEQTEIQRLFQDSKLDQDFFKAFCTLFDLSQCGVKSRFGQEIELIKELSQLGFIELEIQYDRLRSLILDRMMPGVRHNIITKDYLIPVLGLPSFNAIYPAKPSFSIPKNIINRSQLTDFVELIKKIKSKPILLHSGGGQGKTVLLHMLEKELPSNSILIIFDCYGGGTYLNSEDARHKHRRAIPQISNELAIKSGGPLLINQNLKDEDFLQAIKERIEISITLIRKENPDSLVVIAIDSAHNSIFAAAEKSERSFVYDLLKLSMPENSRLIISCRTENLNMFVDHELEMFILKEFTENESSQKLRFYFPNATDNQCSEFHKLTKGIPRTQSYILEKNNLDLEKALQPLRPDGKLLDEIIKSQIKEAANRGSISKSILTKIQNLLIILPRKIPIRYLSKLSDSSEGALRSFCIDVGFGIKLENDELFFTDQDFEDYLHQHTVKGSILFNEIAECLYKAVSRDEYAATHVANFLCKTKQFNNLIKIILQDDLNIVITDPIEKQKILIDRIKYALLAYDNVTEHRVDILKALFIGAETLKTDKALKELLIKNPDLALKYANVSNIQQFIIEKKNKKWPFPILIQTAAIYSKKPDKIQTAKENMSSALAWLDKRDIIPENEQCNYPISDIDIIAGAEVNLRIKGAAELKNWLKGWGPKEAIYKIIYKLAIMLIKTDGQKKIENYFSNIKISGDIALVIIRAYNDLNLIPPKDFVKRVCIHLLKKKKPSDSLLHNGIGFCEIALKTGINKSIISKLLRVVTKSSSLGGMHPHIHEENESKIDTLLVSFTLKSLNNNLENEVDKLIDKIIEPIKKETKDNKHKNEKWEEWKRILSFLSKAYIFRAKVLYKNLTNSEAITELNSCLEQLKYSYHIRERTDRDAIYKIFISKLIDGVLSFADDIPLYLNQIDEALENLDIQTYNLKLTLAEKTAIKVNYQNESLSFLKNLEQNINKAPLISDEKIEYLIKCSRVAEIIDQDEGRHYFQLAIDAAKEIDYEAMHELTCLSMISQNCIASCDFEDPKLAFLYARFAEDCHYKLEGSDGFPWEHIIKAIYKINPSSVFAIIRRWDDKSVLKIEEWINFLLNLCLQNSFISPEIITALSILGEYDQIQYIKLLKSILDKSLSLDYKLLREVISIITRDIQLYTYPSDLKDRVLVILDWAKRNNLDNLNEILPLIKLNQFITSIFPNKKGNKKDSDADLYEENEYTIIFKDEPFTTVNQIKSAYNTLKKSSYYDQPSLEQLYTLLTDVYAPTEYTSVLDQIINLALKNIPDNFYLQGLIFRIDKWSVSSKVQAWKKDKDNAVKYLNNRIASFTEYDFNKEVQFFKQIFNIKDQDIFEYFVKICPNLINLSAWENYEIIGTLSHSIDITQSKDLLYWVLNRHEKTINKEYIKAEWSEELIPPNSPNEILGVFIWTLFGHPSKEIRCRAAHTVNRLLPLGNTEILENIIKNANDDKYQIFTDSEFYFFKLSARLWLGMLLNHLSKYTTKQVAKYVQWIFNEAINPPVPHVLMQHYLKHTMINMHSFDKKIYSNEDIDKIKKLNESSFPLLNDSQLYFLSKSKNPWKERKFHIDPIDTLPYWYEPLARVFGANPDDVADMAVEFILKELNIPKDSKIDKAIHWRYRRGTSNDHGSSPWVESLHLYAEWHSMFYVANKLLTEKPVLIDLDGNNAFDKWMNRWISNNPERWIADLLDPVPLEQKYWQLEFVEDKNCIKNIPIEYFDKRSGLFNNSFSGYLVVNEENNIMNKHFSEKIEINTAIVKIDNAREILVKYQSAKLPYHENKMPLENIDKVKNLTQWLRGYKRELDEFNEHDPLRNGIPDMIIYPGNQFIKWCNIVPTNNKKEFLSKNLIDKKITFYECWDNVSIVNNGHSKEALSSGYRFLIENNFLLNYLKHDNYVLLFELLISRNYHNYEDNSWESSGFKARYYLLYPNGDIVTLNDKMEIYIKSKFSTNQS